MTNFSMGLRALVGVGAVAALSACGGGGGGSDGATNGGTNGGSTSGGYVLFATDLNTSAIAAFTTLDPTPGQALTAHIVKSDEGATGIAYDVVHDDLYAIRTAMDQPTVTIDVFAHASRMATNAAPARTIRVTGLSDGTNAIAIDTSRDELWVSGQGEQVSNSGGRMTVISNASTRNGSVTPDRDIAGLPNALTFALDRKHSVLYLGAGNSGIVVYPHADTLVTGGAFTTISGVTAAYGLAIDEQRDILYVPSVFTGLAIVRNASKPSPTIDTVVFPSETPCLTVAVDGAHDRLYVGAYTNAYVFDNASTLTSASVVPGATVSAGPGTSIYSFAFP